MRRLLLVVAIAMFVVVPFEAYAQDAASRASDLAAALDKNKYKKKEKANVSIEIYIDIKNQPVVRDAYDFGGNYQSEDGSYRLALSVERGGTASGTGQDLINGDQRMGFTLQNARIDGALLVGTKVYENGQSEKFEAVFVNRTVAAGKNANEIASSETAFGLGFIQRSAASDPNKGTTNWTNRVFLERR